MSRQFERESNPAALRRREHVFEHWRAEIVRFGRDERTLNAVAARALHHSEVRADTVLESQIRQFVQQRRADLARARVPHEEAAPALSTGSHGAAASISAVEHTVTVEEAAAIVRGLDEHMSEYISHLFEPEAEAVVDRVRDLCRQFPQLNQHGMLRQYEQRLEQLKRQLAESRQAIDELENKVVDAAERGDHDQAAQGLKRLSSIHAAHPQLLPDHRLADLRHRIETAGAHHEHRLAARHLIEREQAIARELKQIAAAVHHFHKVARRHPPDPGEYALARSAYLKALKEVKAHDREWLAAMVLELVELLAAWDAPPKAQKQVDQFIDSVRKSVAQIRGEIRSIEAERNSEPPPASSGMPSCP